MFIIDHGKASVRTKGHPFPTVMSESAIPPFSWCLINHSCFPLKPDDSQTFESLKKQWELEEEALKNK